MSFNNSRDMCHVTEQDKESISNLRSQKISELRTLRVRIIEVRSVIIRLGIELCKKALYSRNVWLNCDAMYSHPDHPQDEPIRVLVCDVLPQTDHWRDDDSAWIAFRAYTKKGKPGKTLRQVHAINYERFSPVRKQK